MDDEADAAKSAFPSQTNKIDRLVSRNEGFADLCRDFGLVISELRKWEASKAPERDDRVSEFAMLKEELSKEIERALSSAEVFRFKEDSSGRH